jgi:anti-anti-sigma factor
MSAPAGRNYIEWEEAAGVAVLRFTTPVLRDERIILHIFGQIDQLLDAGQNRIVLNFSGLEAFASYAIGKLIALNNKVQPPNGRLALCSLSPMVAEIIDIMNLRKRFHIYANEQQAIESFA